MGSDRGRERHSAAAVGDELLLVRLAEVEIYGNARKRFSAAVGELDIELARDRPLVDGDRLLAGRGIAVVVGDGEGQRVGADRGVSVDGLCAGGCRAVAEADLLARALPVVI